MRQLRKYTSVYPELLQRYYNSSLWALSKNNVFDLFTKRTVKDEGFLSVFSVRTVKRKVLDMVRIVNTEKNNVFFIIFQCTL